MTWADEPARRCWGVFAHGDVADVVHGLDVPVAAGSGGDNLGVPSRWSLRLVMPTAATDERS